MSWLRRLGLADWEGSSLPAACSLCNCRALPAELVAMASPPRKPRSSGPEALPRREQEGLGREMGHCGVLRLGVAIERGKRHTGLG